MLTSFQPLTWTSSVLDRLTRPHGHVSATWWRAWKRGVY